MNIGRNCVWFLEPKNSHANEVLMKGLNDLSEEDILFAAPCADGSRHSLIRCAWSYVAKAQRSRKADKDLIFQVWYKEGNGAIKLWKFDPPKKKVIKIPKPLNFRVKQKPF